MLVVVLGLVTLGLYNYYWLFTTGRTLNRYFHSLRPISSVYVVAAVLVTLADLSLFFVAALRPDLPDIDTVNATIDLAAGILILVWAFKIRDVLSSYVSRTGRGPFPLSQVATFFFSLYYLQYKINRLPQPVVDEPEDEDTPVPRRNADGSSGTHDAPTG